MATVIPPSPSHFASQSERAVFSSLMEAPQGWVVLHSVKVPVKGGRITDHWGGGKVYHWSRRWSAIMSAPNELGLRSGISPRTA